MPSAKLQNPKPNESMIESDVQRSLSEDNQKNNIPAPLNNFGTLTK